MSIMISELYDALTEAGASEDAARKAAQAVADTESRLGITEAEMKIIRAERRIVKWVLVLLVASHFALFAKIW